MRQFWNSPQLDGCIHASDGEADLGSVIPSALRNADVPDIAALIAPREFLFCEARDEHDAGLESLQRFRRIVESAGSAWVRYQPNRVLDTAMLLDWLQSTGQR